MTKKNDSLCFDITSLNEEQKKEFAKNLKKTMNDFNESLETKHTEESEE